jgi:hypothetical protein
VFAAFIYLYINAVFARQPSNSPASYFRDTNMPAPVIADCLNYNLRFTRGVEDVGILLTEDGHVNELRAVNLTHRAAPSGAGIPRIYGTVVFPTPPKNSSYEFGAPKPHAGSAAWATQLSEDEQVPIGDAAHNR